MRAMISKRAHRRPARPRERVVYWRDAKVSHQIYNRRAKEARTHSTPVNSATTGYSLLSASNGRGLATGKEWRSKAAGVCARAPARRPAFIRARTRICDCNYTGSGRCWSGGATLWCAAAPPVAARGILMELTSGAMPSKELPANLSKGTLVNCPD